MCSGDARRERTAVHRRSVAKFTNCTTPRCSAMENPLLLQSGENLDTELPSNEYTNSIVLESNEHVISEPSSNESVNPPLIETNENVVCKASSNESVEPSLIETDGNPDSAPSRAEYQIASESTSDMGQLESKNSPNNGSEGIFGGALSSSQCFKWWGLQPLTNDEKETDISPLCCTSVCIARPLILLAVAIIPIVVLSIMGLTSEAHLDLGIDQFRLSNQDCRQITCYAWLVDKFCCAHTRIAVDILLLPACGTTTRMLHLLILIIHTACL